LDRAASWKKLTRFLIKVDGDAHGEKATRAGAPLRLNVLHYTSEAEDIKRSVLRSLTKSMSNTTRFAYAPTAELC
jgi:hypothetical protein